MSDGESTSDARREAVRRLKNKRAFQHHLVSYVTVNVLLVVIWAVTGGGFFWPAFTIGGWGIGIAMHGWSAYGQRPISEADIEREMGRADGTGS